jgi:hypothetical protein
MTELFVQEAWVNATKGWGVGESGVYETGYERDELGDLFRAIRRKYGRCVGRVYVDLDDAPATPVGWVFVKRQRYEDVNETFLMETWVTVHEAPDTVTRTPHYVKVG